MRRRCPESGGRWARTRGWPSTWARHPPRAQELRFAWERFVAGRGHRTTTTIPTIVREAIGDSWRRSLAAGVDPTGNEPRRSSPTRSALRALGGASAGPRGAADPRLPRRHRRRGGVPRGRHRRRRHAALDRGQRAAEHARGRVMNFAEGTLWSEPGAGTNAIGTALAVDHAVQVFGPEHFNELVQRWTCSAAPIHDPDTGEPLGVIDLTGDFSTVHPRSLAVAMATARAVEASLGSSCRSATRACAPATAPGAAAPGSRALVSPTGRADHPVPPSWGDRRAGSIPPGGGALALPSGATRSPSRSTARCEAFVVRAREQRANRCPPLLKLSMLGRDRAMLESAAARPSCGRGSPRSSRCCARIRRAKRRDAVRGPARRRRQPGQRARRGVPAAQAARPVDRHRSLPAHLRLETDVRRVEGLLARRPRSRRRRALPGPAAPGFRGARCGNERERLDPGCARR